MTPGHNRLAYLLFAGVPRQRQRDLRMGPTFWVFRPILKMVTVACSLLVRVYKNILHEML